jgi:hypothetical protein
MSIANEPSSDVATAVFTRQTQKAEIEVRALTMIVLEVHSTLRSLTMEAIKLRRSRISPAAAPSNAATGGG